MPIFDQGYQHWQGTLSGHAARWLTISRYGVRAQMRAKLAIVWIVAAWLPALLLAGALVLWGLIEQKSPLIAPMLGPALGILRLSPDAMTDPKAFRVEAWTQAFVYFFNVQIFFAMVLLVIVAPGLISQDLRFNAMPLYFSRPLRRIDYFAGKLGITAYFLAMVTLVPALLAYFLGIFFSLDLHVVLDTSRLLGAAILYCLLIMLSAGTLILALSSLSRRSPHWACKWHKAWASVPAMASGPCSCQRYCCAH